jgi:hypothetical protein
MADLAPLIRPRRVRASAPAITDSWRVTRDAARDLVAGRAAEAAFARRIKLLQEALPS